MTSDRTEAAIAQSIQHGSLARAVPGLGAGDLLFKCP